MTTDPIVAYQEAIHNLEAATRKAESIAEIIVDAADKLRDWKYVSVSNTGVGFPAELVMGQHPSINGHDWPTAQQLAETLAAWHNARHAVRNAYNAIPADRQGVVQPPPDF